MLFQNREDAATRLAERLGKLRGKRPLILAIPRGAVPMGRILAESLDGDLDIVLVRKLAASWNPELALGAVDESGKVFICESIESLEHSRSYLEEIAKDELETIRRRRRLYTPQSVSQNPQGRIVVVVDDGIATGSTMMAALRSVRAQKPARLIAVVGVASQQALSRLRREADDVIALATPEPFFAVGQFYLDFPQVSDEEVIRILHERLRQSHGSHIQENA